MQMVKKFFLTFLGAAVLFSGCAKKDAFSKFDIDYDKELGIDHAVYTKIRRGHNISGVSIMVYLNNVYPDRYDDTERFYVVMFARKKGFLNNFQFLLNGEHPIEVKLLPRDNEYAHILDYDQKWTKHYLLVYQKQKKKKLTLDIRLLDGSTATASFVKIPR
jgi:hypothetical protein